MSTDHLVAEALIDHNTWATRQLLDFCRDVDDGEFRRDLGVGPGSLERILAHVIDCMYYFGDGLAGREYVERADLEEGTFSIDELADHLDRAGSEVATATRGIIESRGIESNVEFPVGSGRETSALVVLAQLADHGSHHRSQCLVILRRLGIDPIPECHPLRWAGVD